MKKRYIFIISALLAHALLTGCWQSQINKNFLVVDDLCQPVKDAHIYILRKEPIPLFSFTDNLIWKDRNTAANFKKNPTTKEMHQ